MSRIDGIHTPCPRCRAPGAIQTDAIWNNQKCRIRVTRGCRQCGWGEISRQASEFLVSDDVQCVTGK